jgi:hypothetical protein
VRLVADLVAGVAAAGVAYWVASAILSEPTRARVAQRRSLDERAHALAGSPRDRAAVRMPTPARAAGLDRTDARTTDAPEDPRALKQRASMNLLRNQVIVASAENMGRRGVSVMSCLDGVHLSGAEKIRFAVEVESTANQATTGQWRFVEIAEGEPLPDSFAACAMRAFGTGQRIAPPPGEQFPDYRGELMMLYTIPAAAE